MTTTEAITWLQKTGAAVSYVHFLGCWEATKVTNGFVFAGKGDTFEEACQQLWVLLDDFKPEDLIEPCPTCGWVKECSA